MRVRSGAFRSALSSDLDARAARVGRCPRLVRLPRGFPRAPGSWRWHPAGCRRVSKPAPRKIGKMSGEARPWFWFPILPSPGPGLPCSDYLHRLPLHLPLPSVNGASVTLYAASVASIYTPISYSTRGVYRYPPDIA
jgi:hypothetical protein